MALDEKAIIERLIDMAEHEPIVEAYEREQTLRRRARRRSADRVMAALRQSTNRVRAQHPAPDGRQR